MESEFMNESNNSERNLRFALRANAASSALFGIGGLIFAGRVVDFLGTGNTVIVRLIAAGLVAFAAFVVYVSFQPTSELRAESLLVSLGDLGWVAASIVLIALGLFTTAGAVATGVIAAMVLDFALIQLWTRAKSADSVLA